MVSRYDRDRLSEIIHRYLGEELTAFKLDEALSEVGATTKDQTVKEVVGLLRCHYDDIEDHKVVASKEEWDYFQRLLLVLKSDARLFRKQANGRGRRGRQRQRSVWACSALPWREPGSVPIFWS